MNKLNNSSTYFKFEVLILLLFYALIFWVYQFTQHHISYEAEPLLDAHHYLRSYLFFKGDISHYQVGFPFNTRIAMPFFAAILPTDDVILNFTIIHFILIGTTVYVLHLIFKELKMSLPLRLLSMFFFFFFWLSPIRFIAHEPIQTDSACYLIFALFILFLLKDQFIAILVLSMVSVFFKEALLPLLFVTSIYYVFQKDAKKVVYLFTCFIIGLFTLYLLRYFFPPQQEHWQHHGIVTILRIIKIIALNPLIVVRWFSALVASFGVLLLFNNYSKQHLQQLSTWLLIVSLLLALFAGGDHTRIMITAFPFVVWFLHDLQLQKTRLFILFGLSIPCFHLFSILPNITEPSYNTWFMEYTDWNTITMVLSYAVGCYVFMKVMDKLEFD